MPALPTCFVVMPYGVRPVEDVEVHFDEIFLNYIAPAAEAAGFAVVRSDLDGASGVIMPRLFTSIFSAELVIADITYQNPNVYYELGVRHALCPQGTLLIRREGGDFAVQKLKTRHRGASSETAFDIKGVTIYSYALNRDQLPAAIDSLKHQIERVANTVEPDSPAFLYLEGLRVVTGSPRAHARDDRTYEVLNEAGKPTGRFVGYRSGDLKELRDGRAVDFWVNSENVLMQMARIYERSVSATIRYLGARQPDPNAPDFEDTIAIDLARQMGNRHATNQGEVMVTTSGRLRETHGVKAILHAAVVTGAPGRGFQPIPDDLLVETTRTVLATARQLVRSDRSGGTGGSLIMPLFGTGQGRLNPIRTTERLFQESIQDLAYHAAMETAPDLTTVLFSVFTKDHVSLARRLLDQWVEQGLLRPLPTTSDFGIG
jgi:hypothetical protein